MLEAANFTYEVPETEVDNSSPLARLTFQPQVHHVRQNVGFPGPRGAVQEGVLVGVSHGQRNVVGEHCFNAGEALSSGQMNGEGARCVRSQHLDRAEAQ